MCLTMRQREHHLGAVSCRAFGTRRDVISAVASGYARKCLQPTLLPMLRVDQFSTSGARNLSGREYSPTPEWRLCGSHAIRLARYMEEQWERAYPSAYIGPRGAVYPAAQPSRSGGRE